MKAELLDSLANVDNEIKKEIVEYIYKTGKGVELNKALDHSRGNHDTALIKTMNKLPRYIIYIEKEYGIQVFNKTKRRNELMSYA